MGKLLIGENTPEMLQCDLKPEMAALPDWRDAISYWEGVRDFTSRDLFQSILDSEEEHVDWLESQLVLLAKIGLGNYLASQIGPDRGH